MSKRALCLALLALLAGGAEGLAQRPKEKDTLRRPAVHPEASVPHTVMAEVPESELNDDYTTADAVSVGDQATGVIDPAGDWDWWSFTATAGQIIEIDVDASDYGSSLDPTIEVFAADGETSVAYNDDYNSLDSRLEFTAEATGTYYLTITDYSTYFGYGDQGGPDYTYTIYFAELLPGVGDPVTEFATGFECVYGIVTADDGTIYAADGCAYEIKEVATDGTVSTFVSGEWWPFDLTLDAFGNLIVISDDGWIYKVSPAADVTVFDERYAPAIATAPDGSIWIFAYPGGVDAQAAAAAAPGEFYFYRYDPLGTLVDSLAVMGNPPEYMSIGFSPAGELHYATGDTLYKLVEGLPEVVAVDEEYGMGPFTFDADGNIYMVSWEYYDVSLYGSDGTLLEDPFAREVHYPLDIVFGRDADGTPNGRLFVSDMGEGGDRASPSDGPQRVAQAGSSILELNPDGVYADGAEVGMSFDLLADDDLADELFGVGELSDGEMEFLDFMGNQNGEYDVGDFRAYLVYIGVLVETLLDVVWR
ncbi:MAG: pre-peptidase C-terminal domain-containing protein [Gemmatimonadales bacterium]|jgi:hypothetical protein